MLNINLLTLLYFFFHVPLRINNHGLTKTLTVRYKCCYGFERTEGSLSGCTKKLNLKTTLETIEENDGKEFTTMIKTAKLDDRLNNENLTVFVPTDNSLNEFTERMLEMVCKFYFSYKFQFIFKGHHHYKIIFNFNFAIYFAISLNDFSFT